MRSKWLRRVLVLLVLVAVVIALRMTVFRPTPVPVTIFRVAPGLVEEVVTNSKAGTVKTRRRAALSPEIGGLVMELPVREGNRVEKGQLLLRLSDADYRATLALRERAIDTARAGRHEACTNAEQAQRELVRNTRLAEQEIVSDELLDQYQSRKDVADAACEGARARALETEAALELARVNLAKTVLRAPFGGVVSTVSAELGEWITPSPPGLPIPPVVEILDNDSIYVSAPLDEVDVGRVHVGPAVRITLDAYPGRSFDGRLARVAPFVLDLEEQNRTVEIEVEFDDAEFARTLLPGTSADVEVILDEVHDVLRIPSYALIEGTRVLVVARRRAGGGGGRDGPFRTGSSPRSAAAWKRASRWSSRWTGWRCRRAPWPRSPRRPNGDQARRRVADLRDRRHAGPRPAVVRPGDRRRRLRGDHGSFRLGEIDAAQHHRLPGPAHVGILRPRRQGGGPAERGGAVPGAPPPHRLHLPDLPPGAAADRHSERGAADDLRRRRASRAPGAGARRRWRRWISPTAPPTGRTSSPAASASAWRSPGRW